MCKNTKIYNKKTVLNVLPESFLGVLLRLLPGPSKLFLGVMSKLFLGVLSRLFLGVLRAHFAFGGEPEFLTLIFIASCLSETNDSSSTKHEP